MVNILLIIFLISYVNVSSFGYTNSLLARLIAKLRGEDDSLNNNDDDNEDDLFK